MQRGFTYQSFSSKNLRGFTLVELLVVLGIILLLSVIIFANYRAGQKEYILQLEAYKIVQNIRKVQEWAMSAKEIGPVGDKVFPVGGYGIAFNINDPPGGLGKDKYVLFIDCNDNHFLDLPPAAPCGALGFSEIVEEIKLESGVKINRPYRIVGGISFPKFSAYITFTSPDPVYYERCWGGAGPFPTHQPVAIEIELNGKSKKIKVISTGLIEIID